MEVQLNDSVTKQNPFNDNINKLITLISISLDSLIPTTKDSGIKIRVNANNSIIHTNQDESTYTPEDEAPRFRLKTKNLYKRTKATIKQIVP